MAPPHGLSWVEESRLAAMARPSQADDLIWLRQQRIELLICLTEDRPPRDWINDSGLLLMHVPVEDMTPPTQAQLDHCLSAIARAHERNMAVAIHCGAGLGRTGVVLACYLVEKGLAAQNAIARVRRLRPGSIETDEQAEAVVEFARRRGQTLHEG